ncbi:MAG: bifunctional UDP-N-acetylglucosamine diphosphorylase/glucosamine-1-phosphate N-acetyltransferase GlmU [Parahaliea sp.]
MKLEIIILAAGQGTRMRSDLPKVLHQVAGKPMLGHVINTAKALSPTAIHVVVGHGADIVSETMADNSLNWVLQSERLGTGHAVLQAMPAIGQDSTVLILYGDVPLISADSLQVLVEQAASVPALLTAIAADASGYGRILRDISGALSGVVEDKDASKEQRAITEINTGVLAAPAALLKKYLPRVGNANVQGEYYLPDILPMAVADGLTVASSLAASEMDILGVNDPLQLAQVEREFQLRQARELMRAGVRIADPGRIDIRGSLRCGRNVSIDVNTVFEGKVELADNVCVGPNCVVINSRIGSDSTVHAMSHLEEAELGQACNVGPYARLRPGTQMANKARIGNFVETKKAQIGEGSKINHLSYVGDCIMGAGVNIGAGTITCNYDGVNKHLTQIGDSAFVGSNSTLVAPIEVGQGGFVAAGSTVTKAIANDELAVARGKQRNIQGWQRPHKKDS